MLMIQAGIDGQAAHDALQDLVNHVHASDASRLRYWGAGYAATPAQQTLISLVSEAAARLDPATAATYFKTPAGDCQCWPHGPDDPCTCPGCTFCTGHEIGCTCDIGWDCEHKEN